jgi:hypothetical protein
MAPVEIIRAAAKNVVSSSALYSVITEAEREEAINYTEQILAQHSNDCASSLLDN